MSSLRDLEQVGALAIGDSIDPNPQTPGGLSDLVFTRTFKVRATLVQNYLFQILDPNIRVTDAQFPAAFLVKQTARRIDDANYHLMCVFAYIPSTWRDHATYQSITMPGVAKSSLYAPDDFYFRPGPVSLSTQVRYEHTYFLGPISGIATLDLFLPQDTDGNAVNTITDFTDPSSDEYVAMVLGRQEFVRESVVVPWRGDIWDRRTMYVLAK